MMDHVSSDVSSFYPRRYWLAFYALSILTGLDVYNRATAFLATLSRDLKQLQDMDVDMEDCNILGKYKSLVGIP